MGVTFAQDTFARGHFCTRTLLHGDCFARRDTFARVDTFARRFFCTSRHFFTRGHFCTEVHFCTRGHFCTATFLHLKTFAPRHLLHDVTFVWRNFCKASFLYEVIILKNYLCTAKIVNNRQLFTKLHFCTLLTLFSKKNLF